MKRTIYLTYCKTFSNESTPEKALNAKILCTKDKVPDCPYIEVEMKVVYHQPRYSHDRTKFSEKIGATIIIPKHFNK